MNYYYQSIAFEAIFVGVLLAVLGLILYNLDTCFKIRKTMLKINNINVELSLYLFIVGVLTHVIYEALGANKWYCKNGAACK